MIKVIDFLKKKYPSATILTDINKQSYWLGWYEGKDDWYKYTVRDAEGEPHQMERFSMNMLSKVCQDWASLLLNEKVSITINETQKNELLKAQLESNNFIPRIQEFIERSFAIGSGAVVVGKTSKGKASLSFVDGTRCYVLECQKGEVTKAAFVTEAGKKKMIVSVHDSEGNVQNFLIKENQSKKDFAELQLERLKISAVEKFDNKTFVFIKPAISRKDNWITPFGQSIFANGIDSNKFLDIIFDSYKNEFILGRKRIFLGYSLLMWKKANTKSDDPNAPVVPMFDLNDTVFNQIPSLGGASQDPSDQIKEVDMKLRQEEHSKAMQDGLNYLSSQCGLGTQYYKFDATTGGVTATEVISRNSDLHRNKRKHENYLKNAIIQLVMAMMAVEGHKVKPQDIAIRFDDSIFIDDEAERNTDRQDVRDGVMSKAEYRVKYYGETEEQAKKAINSIEPVDLEATYANA